MLHFRSSNNLNYFIRVVSFKSNLTRQTAQGCHHVLARRHPAKKSHSHSPLSRRRGHFFINFVARALQPWIRARQRPGRASVAMEHRHRAKRAVSEKQNATTGAQYAPTATRTNWSASIIRHPCQNRDPGKLLLTLRLNQSRRTLKYHLCGIRHQPKPRRAAVQAQSAATCTRPTTARR